MSREGTSVRIHYKALLEIQSQDHEEFGREVEVAFKNCLYQSYKRLIIKHLDSEIVL